MSLSIIAGWFGPTEIIIVLVIVLIFFGGRKIPELMKGLGKGMKEFKDASKEGAEEAKTDNDKKD
ncbi:MAG: twin-arginine translocase TatA/TatE family subunit [Prolixibacteraceae bacterium]|nr:twin-arginine translocase TatA/TatE family subunit [Prolixibacteraceae bacterium]